MAEATITDKILGAITFATTNVLTAFAPALPGNDGGVGGITVNGIAFTANAIVQQLKQYTWFDQDKYAIWTGVGIVVFMCTGVWWPEGPQKVMLNACDGIGLFLTNYGPLKNVKILKEGT